MPVERGQNQIPHHVVDGPDRLEKHEMSEAATKLGWKPKNSFISFLNDLDRRDKACQDVGSFMTTGKLT